MRTDTNPPGTRTARISTTAALAIAIATAIASATPASAQLADIWFIGVDNNSQSDFEQEKGFLTDYYWENGDYTIWGGEVWEGGQEPWNSGDNGANKPEADDLGMPRAVLSSGATFFEIFFQLDEGEAQDEAAFTYRTQLRDARADTSSELEFSMNGQFIFLQEAVSPQGGEEIDVEISFTGLDALAEAGPNVFRVERTGGDTTAGTAWIQFDYHQLELDLTSIGCQQPVCSFSTDRPVILPGETAVLNWLIPVASADDATIDQGVGGLGGLTTNGIGSTTVAPTTNTTYTLTSTFEGTTDTSTVDVVVQNIVEFDSDVTTIFSGDEVFLTWEVDPTATLVLTADNGPDPGPVDHVGGFGDILVSPPGTTTYTLTSTRGPDVETATITVVQQNLVSFTSTDTELFPGEPDPTLDWAVDPAATVTINDGTSDLPGVQEATSFGFGAIQVSPTAPVTTYTLTSSVPGGTTETATVTIEINDYTQLWQIGDDNNANDELEQENGNIVDFYVENGDYSELFPTGDIRTEGPEPWNNGIHGNTGDREGMPRAFTTGFQEINIYFQLTEEQAAPGSEFRLTLDVQSVRTIAGLPSTHDVSLWMNDTLFHEVIDNTTEQIRDTVTASEVGAQPGSNVVTLRRDGGVIPEWPEGTDNPNASWIVFDFYRLEAKTSEPADFEITEIIVDQLIGEVSLTWGSNPGETFRIETSEALESWSTLQAGFPTGGATGTTTKFIHSGGFPGIDGDLYYRVVRE